LLLTALIVSACQGEQEQVEVTRIVEVEGETETVEVTRVVEVEVEGETEIVEVTRVVEVETEAQPDFPEGTMKIVILGSGGVGGYFGGLLARSGQEVTFVARGDHLIAIKERGLAVILEEQS